VTVEVAQHHTDAVNPAHRFTSDHFVKCRQRVMRTYARSTTE
jgi:hypothetical protein